MTTLRLGKIPPTEPIRLSIAVPAMLKTELDRYAAAYAEIYGERIEVAALIPHMLEAFMHRDRGFKRSMQGSRASSGNQVDTETTDRARSSSWPWSGSPASAAGT